MATVKPLVLGGTGTREMGTGDQLAASAVPGIDAISLPVATLASNMIVVVEDSAGNAYQTSISALASFFGATGSSASSTAATAYTTALSATSGTVGSPVTVTVTPVGGSWPSGVTLTASTGLGGSFAASTATPTGTTAATFTFTPSAAGSGSITVAASVSMTNSSGAQGYTASAAPAAPNAVTNLAATPAATSVALTWTESGGAPTTRTVTQRTPSGSGSFVAATLSNGPTATGATVSGLTASTSYDFQVSESNATGGPVTTTLSNVSTTAAASGPANTLTLQAYGGAAFATTGLTVNSYQTTAYGTPNSNNSNSYLTLKRISDGSFVNPQTSASTTFYGWNNDPNHPPTGPAQQLFGGSVPSANGYVTGKAVGSDTQNFGLADNNGGAGIEGTVGNSPSPGTAYYLWASIDSGATWSVARNGSNVATPFMVIF